VKKIALCIVVFSMSLFGCTTAQQADVAQKAQMLQAQVMKACAVVQPTLESVATLESQNPAQKAVFDTLVSANGKVCAAGSSVDATSVASLVNTTIPAALQVVTLIPMDPAVKTGVQIGLIAFQTALSAALAQYGPVAVPVAASAPVA